MFKNISDVKFIFSGIILLAMTVVLTVGYAYVKKIECAAPTQKTAPAVTQKK